MTSQTDNQVKPGARTERGAPIRLHGVVRRIGRWLANQCGLLVVTPETVLEWVQRSSEHNRIAGHYDLSDERLSGLNDGRSQAYLACCQDVQETNAPNKPSSATSDQSL